MIGRIKNEIYIFRCGRLLKRVKRDVMFNRFLTTEELLSITAVHRYWINVLAHKLNDTALSVNQNKRIGVLIEELIDLQTKISKQLDIKCGDVKCTQKSD